MRKILVVVFAVSLYAFTTTPTAYVADVKSSNTHWLGKKTTGQHEGDVKLLSGKLNFDKSTPLNGEFVLDMNSISVTDIKDAEDNKSLVEHLKAEDFFGVAKHPTALLSIKKFDAIADSKTDVPNYMVIADLTIKGIKNEIRFPARINVAEGKATANADITIDRTQWNIVYKSKSILGATADKFIYDEMNFSVNLVLQIQK
jgi:polyisoprenoid-binding protein YceI